jgi:ribonuclease P/MRP protein subunit POP1
MCLWNEIVRLSQVVQPHVSVEDLRFEIGSIEITGPGATEALLGTLRPSSLNPDDPPTISAKTWTSLAGLTDPAHSPANVLLRFDVEDPRLRHPPRTIRLPRTSDEQQRLLETTATWNADDESAPPRIFDRRSRNAASTAMATQKTINRRKSEAAPGEFPLVLPTDPKVPTLIYSSSSGGRAGGSWTVLLPWKFVQPVWYSIMYYPLSTGGQPRFGGLDEKRQLSFEASKPWFPADFPGTAAGWEWELEERRKRKDYWDRRPKSKRINWDAVDTGNSKKGEIGRGWACDWERLLSGPASDDDLPRTGSESNQERPESDATEPAHAGSSQSPPTYISAAMASDMLRSTMAIDSYGEELGTALVTVGISVVTRGAPQTCARVYRLPSSPSSSLRKQWLSLNPKHQLNGQKGPRNSLPRLPEGTPSHVVQQRLARSLLETPQANDDDYPPCPPEEDLIGFVTTGNFNLSEGRGTAVGNILLSRVLDDARQDGEEGRLCIVRNAGNTIGRLARWEIV